MLKVLIVDDEPSVRSRLRKAVKWHELGFDLVGEASDGEEGLEMFKSTDPDIIITDIRMPVFSGLELVQQVKNVSSDINFIVISGYDDFKYAQKALKFGVKDYLLKPIDERELTAALLRIKEETQQRFKLATQMKQAERLSTQELMADLVYNRRRLQPEELDVLLGRPVAECRFGIMVAEMDELLGDGLDDEVELAGKTEVRKALDDWIQRRTESGGIWIDERNDRFALMYIFGTDASDSDLYKEADGLREHVDCTCGQSVTIGVSGVVREPIELAGAYRAARAAIEGKFILGSNRIIVLDDILQTSGGLTWETLTNWDPTELLEAIEYYDRSAVLTQCSALFNILKKNGNSFELVETLMIENLMRIGRMVTTKHGDVTQIVGEHFRIDRLFQKNGLPELEAWFTGLCVKASDYMLELRQNRVRRVSDRMIEIIKERYAEEITLKSLAGVVYMNPVYLGQLFKHETGKSFNEYVTDIRIKQAINLLAETDLHVYEIAEKVGYSAPNQFYLSFKKKIGCNPIEYRSRIRGLDTGRI